MHLWKEPPLQPKLAANEIHVWQTHLDRPDSDILHFLKQLSSDEQERASRCLSATHRSRFISARGVLRRLLGLYLDLNPAQLQFSYGAHGKPTLCQPDQGLCFNLSHSGEIALYAIGSRRRLGIDVEDSRRPVAYGDLVQRFFSTQEATAFQEVHPDQQARVFYHCWTRKEAYLKALGQGISVRLDSFSVSCKPGEPVALLHCEHCPDEIGQWQLTALEIQPNYVGALCAEKTDWELQCWRWHD